jgi:heme-degrading monooxygenase HmoA
MRTTVPPSEYTVYSTGSWKPFVGQEQVFVEAWEDFAGWAAGLDGAGEAILTQDQREEGRYVSFLGWRDIEALRAWKGDPEFKERMSRVQKFVDKFAPTELDVVARARQQ